MPGCSHIGGNARPQAVLGLVGGERGVIRPIGAQGVTYHFMEFFETETSIGAF